MASALSRQLAAQIPAVPRSSKSRPSLLYDAREAATVDVATIHSGAVQALEELAEIDSRLYQFRGSLFAPSMITFERDLQTADELAKLDSMITHFLRVVSPHVLRPTAHSALEFLIRRFAYVLAVCYEH